MIIKSETMKWLLVFFLFFSSIAIGMDRFETIAFLRRQAEHEKQERRDKLGYELGSYLQGILHREKLQYNLDQNEQKRVKELIEQGANVNQELNINTGYSYTDYWYPLFFAVALGDEALIRQLIEHGAHVDIQLNRGADTPLIWAARHGKVNVVRFLTQGVIVNEQQLKEMSEPKQESYLSLLPEELKKMTFANLRVKANPNIRNKEGKTALDEARVQLAAVVDPQYPLVNADQVIRDYEEIINILEPITAQEQPQRSWWQRLTGRQ